MSGRKPPGEFALIARYFAPLAKGYPGALDLTDDAALVEIDPGCRLVVTADALVAGVHFLADDPPDLVAKKTLRVNLSDLAAMGARPFAYMLTMALPTDTAADWLERFAAGLAADQETFGLSLVGGDTVATTGPVSLSVTALGQVPVGAELRRSAAQAGDAVFVSGTVGDAALGLRILRGEVGGLASTERDHLVRRYRLPEPRLNLGSRLAGLARAAIDVSDGLVADLGHICAASGLAAVIEAAQLPLSAAARTALERDPGLMKAVLTGGDDNELLFTVPEDDRDRVRALADEIGLPLTQIGGIVEGSGVKVVDAAGAEIALGQGGWRHF